MSALALADRDRITIAILALGGEGGGVLADWILETASHNGFVAQGTSVPGVAQRTGSTIYYIEMLRRPPPGANRPQPVLAMMPAPGDVDVVIASELMEMGRAMVRGFVTDDRTTLIGSTHRVYAVSEKSALGDGVVPNDKVLEAAHRRAARFIGFDMAQAASASRSVISSVMFGALAGSDALPFPPEAFEAAIRQGGKAVESNLTGFRLGLDNARKGGAAPRAPAAVAAPEPTTAAGRQLMARITTNLPASAKGLAAEGVRRAMEFQDRAYAELYLTRLEALGDAADPKHDLLIAEAARHLAVWMTYDDTIRVADLKIRESRARRITGEMGVTPAQVASVTDYFHPRLQEVCETLPAGIGSAILARPALKSRLEGLFRQGRHVRTTSLSWFLPLYLLSSLRGMRRSTLRYKDEQGRIEGWLDLVGRTAQYDVSLAVEIVRSQQLLKGYSDTFERGLSHFNAIMQAAASMVGERDAARRVRGLNDAALADDTGAALAKMLVTDPIAA